MFVPSVESPRVGCCMETWGSSVIPSSWELASDPNMVEVSTWDHTIEESCVVKWISTYTNRHITYRCQLFHICMGVPHTVLLTGGATGAVCSRPSGMWAPKQCSTHSNTYPSLASLSNSFRCIVDFKSACFFASHLCCSDANFNIVILRVYCAVC